MVIFCKCSTKQQLLLDCCMCEKQKKSYSVWLDWLDVKVNEQATKRTYRMSERVGNGPEREGKHDFDQNTYDHLIKMRDANAHTSSKKSCKCMLSNHVSSAYARPTNTQPTTRICSWAMRAISTNETIYSFWLLLLLCSMSLFTALCTHRK